VLSNWQRHAFMRPHFASIDALLHVSHRAAGALLTAAVGTLALLEAAAEKVQVCESARSLGGGGGGSGVLQCSTDGRGGNVGADGSGSG
jgi:hypothetical protein